MALLPVNAELVAVSWLRTLPLDGAPVATTVPEPASSWESSGFLQVTTAAGGFPHLYTGRQASVVQVDAWAYNAGSRTPPFGRAATLLARVKAVVDGVNVAARVTTPATFHDARLFGVASQSDPVRVPDPEGGMAHYQMDLQVWWVAIPEGA